MQKIAQMEREAGLDEVLYLMSCREGIGSVYEHLMVKELFQGLINDYSINRVLTLGCECARGLDNVAFCFNRPCEVILIDPSLKVLEGSPLLAFPSVQDKVSTLESNLSQTSLDDSSMFDVVWNFAVIQQYDDPQVILREMVRLSRKLVVVFVPNARNIGKIFHTVYHLLSQTECHHAERGYKKWMLLENLEKEFPKAGLKIIGNGYIDIPPFPDIAASLKEWRELFFKPKSNPVDKNTGTYQVPDISLENAHTKVGRIKKLANVIEKRSRFRSMRFLEKHAAHHMYIVGEITDAKQ
ncbi:methyltransferase domain-containing protein [Chloroflexota bacterium]